MIAKFLKESESIECEMSCVATRKISRNPVFLKIEALDGTFLRLFKYKTNIRATVTVIQELNPKDPIIEETSKLDLHSTLEAEVVEIYTKRKINIELTANFTSTHTIQGSNVNVFTFAKIVTPWRFILQRALGE